MQSSDSINRKSNWEELLAQLPARWRSALLDEPTDNLDLESAEALEDALDAVREKSTRTDEEVAELRARLDRLERDTS